MDAGAVLLRLALYLDLSLLFGLPAFAIYGVPGPARLDRPFALRRFVVIAAGLGILLSALVLVMLAASMAGVPLGEVDRETLGMLIGGTSAGTAWIVRMAALLLALMAVLLAHRRPKEAIWAITSAAAVALATLTWGGHGAMDDSWVHLLADIVHILAAAAWIGALLGLCLLLFRRADAMEPYQLLLAHRALAGFATAGTIIVGAIIASGLINVWMVVGPANFLTLPVTIYGQLLIAKLALFAVMLALAASHRFRMVPAFEQAITGGDHAGACAALRRSLIVEGGCALAILALVSWLGTLDPVPMG